MRFDIDPRADQLDSAVLRCRSDGHVWERIGEDVSETSRRGIIREIRVTRACYNCECVRVDNYSLPTFALVKRHYNVREDYKVARNESGHRDRLSRQTFRAAYLHRELKELLNE